MLFVAAEARVWVGVIAVGSAGLERGTVRLVLSGTVRLVAGLAEVM
jgi:hypothetical protein